MFTKKAVIDRIEGKTAILQTEDGQTLKWDTDELPASLKGEGNELVIEIKDIQENQKSQRELARSVLSELFNHE
jgi:hypothetical protein